MTSERDREPIDHPTTGDDLRRAPVGGRRYEDTGRGSGRDRRASVASTDALRPHPGTDSPNAPMDTRKVHVEHLHAQIERDAYRVDPDAVAEAILRRLLTQSVPPRRADGDA
jgi:anti-sigma28 factor (negative regulator of flagellin synthesis)